MEDANSPQRNTKPPNRLGLKAIHLGHTRPAHEPAIPAHVPPQACKPCVGVVGVGVLEGAANGAAVCVGERTTEDNGDDNEGEEEEGVEERENEEGEAAFGVEEGEGDEGIEGGDAGLGSECQVASRMEWVEENGGEDRSMKLLVGLTTLSVPTISLATT